MPGLTVPPTVWIGRTRYSSSTCSTHAAAATAPTPSLSLCLQPRQRRASVRAAQVGATVWASAGGSASRNGTARVEPIAPAALGAGEGGRVMAWLNVLGLILNLVGSGHRRDWSHCVSSGDRSDDGVLLWRFKSRRPG